MRVSSCARSHLVHALTLDTRQPRAPEKQPAFKDQEMPEAEPELASGYARVREMKREGRWRWVGMWGQGLSLLQVTVPPPTRRDG